MIRDLTSAICAAGALATVTLATIATAGDAPFNRFELQSWARVSSTEVEEDTSATLRRIAQDFSRTTENREFECLADPWVEPCGFRKPYPPDPGVSRHDWARGWLDATGNSGYAKELARWQMLAESAQIIERGDGVGEIVVHAIGSTAGDDILAECEIDTVNGTRGAVRDCTPVAIISSDRSWISVILGRFSSAATASGGLPDFDLQIVAPSRMRLSRIAGAVDAALRQAPLDLAVTRRRDSIFGVASYRDSPVITGWREILTVRVDIQASADTSNYRAPAGFGLVISTALYLNRQNTERTVDYHLPSAAQQDQYVAYLRQRLSITLGRLCGVPTWQAHVLFCDMPPSTPLPPIERY